jgi:hypothetical protein
VSRPTDAVALVLAAAFCVVGTFGAIGSWAVYRVDGAIARDGERADGHVTRKSAVRASDDRVTGGGHFRPGLVTNWKTSSSGFPNARAIWNATSSEGKYLPPSIAFTVWRVTPTRSASSCCVISC